FHSRHLLSVGPGAAGAADQFQSLGDSAPQFFPFRNLRLQEPQWLIADAQRQLLRRENYRQYFSRLIATIARRLRGEIAVLIFLRRNIDQLSRQNVVVSSA